MTSILTLIILQWQIWIYASLSLSNGWQSYKKRLFLKFLSKTYIQHCKSKKKKKKKTFKKCFKLCELYPIFCAQFLTSFLVTLPQFQTSDYFTFCSNCFAQKRFCICINNQFYATFVINIQTQLYTDRYIYTYQYRCQIGKSCLRKMSMEALGCTSKNPNIKKNQFFAVEIISPSLIRKFLQV